MNRRLFLCALCVVLLASPVAVAGTAGPFPDFKGPFGGPADYTIVIKFNTYHDCNACTPPKKI
jgi:hypothetical protein